MSIPYYAFYLYCLQFICIMLLKITIAILFIPLFLSLPNPASYIKANNRPLNIAHRGLCSLLPENTLESFESALYQGADFIELDVVYTKQKTLLVMHDPYLTRITNIKNFTDWSRRTNTRVYEGKTKTDWWTDDFTLEQLRKLGIKQDQAPGRITRFDYKFGFPTLDEVVKMVIEFNKKHKGTRNPDGRLGGILIEAKDSQMYRDLYGIQIGESVLQVLRNNGIETIEKAQKICPIYLHSFNYETVKYWASHTELPRNYLIQDSVKFDLEDINKYATGIGFEDDILWDYDTNTVTDVLEKTRQLGMQVHIWTFKDDDLLFNSPDNLKMYEIAQKQMCLDGVITQSPDIYAAVSQMYKNQASKCHKYYKHESLRRVHNY